MGSWLIEGRRTNVKSERTGIGNRLRLRGAYEKAVGGTHCGRGNHDCDPDGAGHQAQQANPRSGARGGYLLAVVLGGNELRAADMHSLGGGRQQ
jgi:hypothetical protein